MSDKKHLPVFSDAEQFVSSLDPDGHRRFVYPADVKGRFRNLRLFIFAALVGIWIALPLIQLNGKPLVLARRAGAPVPSLRGTFNAQDIWLVFFLLTGFGFLLALATSLLGRVWCGYACPQTVFLEGMFRPIERLIEGNRDQRMRLDKAPWTASKVAKKVAKHAAFLLAAFFVAHVFLSFFVPLPMVAQMVMGSPSAHPEAFAWAAAVTGMLYGNFAWAREQVCLIVCPYGRMQGALVDDDSLVIGYDKTRGEPRGKLKDEGRGACIDCKRCVVVCPTGIDIRNGLQLDCIGCSACVDACDDVMDKIGQPSGLVRYDSQRSLAGLGRRFWRPRLALYAVLGIAGLIAMSLAFSSRISFEANLLRNPGPPYVVEGDTVRNVFSMHLVNKDDRPKRFELVPTGQRASSSPRRAARSSSSPEEASQKIAIAITAPKGSGDAPFVVLVKNLDGEEQRAAQGSFLGPR
jgi:cytochrome c oxidase accessory protein FixG